MVHAPRIFRISIGVDRLPAILFGKELLDLPCVGLDSNRELEVLFRDIVPELYAAVSDSVGHKKIACAYLVHHHDR